MATTLDKYISSKKTSDTTLNKYLNKTYGDKLGSRLSEVSEYLKERDKQYRTKQNYERAVSEANKYREESDRLNNTWQMKVDPYVQSFKQGVKETAAGISDVGFRLSPLEGFKNTTDAVMNAIYGDKSIPLKSRLEQGYLDSKARQTLFEKTTGKSLTKAEGGIDWEQGRKFIGRSMEAPTYFYSGLRGIFGAATGNILKRVGMRVLGSAPEAAINTALQRVEDKNTKILPAFGMNLAAMGVLSNVTGEVGRMMGGKQATEAVLQAANQPKPSVTKQLMEYVGLDRKPFAGKPVPAPTAEDLGFTKRAITEPESPKAEVKPPKVETPDPLIQEARKGKLAEGIESDLRNWKRLSEFKKGAVADELGYEPKTLDLYHYGKNGFERGTYASTDQYYAESFKQPGDKLFVKRNVPIEDLKAYGEGRIIGKNARDGKSTGIEVLYDPKSQPLQEGVAPKVTATEEVKVPKSQVPVGEGEVKYSKLEQSVKSSLDNAPDEVKNLSTYKMMNNEEQIKKATKYVLDNPDEAMDVLLGKKPEPKGMLRNSIYVAMANNSVGDPVLATKLASLQSTRYGQEIEILRALNRDNPVKYIQELGERKINIVGGKERVTQYVQKQVAKAEEVISKTKAKMDWNGFIDSIKC